ncbi:MAG TPA: signal peptide peptidase SppA [Phycisphaerae bacterium]
MTDLKAMRAARFIMSLFLLSALTGCMPSGLLITPVSTNRALMEETLASESPLATTKIALIEVSGLILDAPQPQLLGEGEHPVSLLMEQLEKARHDSAVKAVVLRINSPGGAVTASELMHDEIVRFRKDTGRPVVAALMDVAASGAYYIACACDDIVAQRSSVTGSIGVIMQMFDLTGTLNKIGARSEAITSGPNKAAGSPFETMTPEQRALFQTMVDEMYNQFVDVVSAGRPKLTRERIVELADGRVYTAGQALQNGLIDRIATMHDTIALAKQKVGAKSIRLVGYRRPVGYKPNYYAHAPTPGSGDVNLIKLDLPAWLRAASPQFMYLWVP